MKPHKTPLRIFTLFVFALSAYSQTSQNLQYNYAYSCNKERVIIGRCRHDSDMRGFPPTKPEDDYCQVVYPDRPKRGGLTVETVELRSDVIQKLASCGAFGGSLSSEPSSEEAYLTEFSAGKALYDKKDYAGAIPYFTRSLAMKPIAGVYSYLGSSYYELGQYDNAILAFKKQVALEPGSPDAHRNLATSYQDAKQHENAIAEYKAVLGFQPDNAQVMNNLGNCYLDLEKYPEALKEFGNAVRLKPESVTFRYNLGSTYVDMGNKVEARKVYNVLVKMDKAVAQELLDEINDSDLAPTPDKGGNIIFLKPSTVANSPAVLVEQAAKYFDAKDYAKAIEACKKAIAMEPKNPEANFYLAVSYDQSEQWESAVKAWNNYIPLVKPYPTEFVLLGDAHRYLKHYDEALNAYQKALDLKPDAKKASGVYYWIGTIYNDTKQYDKAIDPLLTSIGLDPNYRHSRLALGRAYFLTGRPAEGIASLKEAIRIKPDFAEAHYYLGLCYLMVGKKEKAMEVYKFLQTIDKGWASELLKYINSP